MERPTGMGVPSFALIMILAAAAASIFSGTMTPILVLAMIVSAAMFCGFFVVASSRDGH